MGREVEEPSKHSSASPGQKCLSVPCRWIQLPTKAGKANPTPQGEAGVNRRKGLQPSCRAICRRMELGSRKLAGVSWPHGSSLSRLPGLHSWHTGKCEAVGIGARWLSGAFQQGGKADWRPSDTSHQAQGLHTRSPSPGLPPPQKLYLHFLGHLAICHVSFLTP